jgi:LAS superfamily LD-carboxypeptidase LdcB
MAREKWFWIAGAAFALFAAAVGGGYLYFKFKLGAERTALREEFWEMERVLDLVKSNSRRLGKEKADLEVALAQERGTASALLENLRAEEAKNNLFESQIRNISSTVGTLKKLSETDRELLKKYSKVYFLSENYVPSSLVEVDAQYLFDRKKPERFHANAAPFLSRMLSEALGSGISLEIVSGYRSFYDQMSVKTGYKVLYGEGANQFSADQGYSEHQLGTTIDFTTPELAGLSLQLEKQPAYQWLAENAYRFGFVLSYPKNNAYYQFEPWHWRFVGVALATKLKNENKYFYDLSQREIDPYLISIFD